MILAICTTCWEGVTLTKRGRRQCPCGKGYGYFEGDRVVLSPDTLPVGLGNSSIMRAYEDRPYTGWGRTVEALVMPHASFIIDEGGKHGPSKDVSAEPDGGSHKSRGVLPRVSGTEQSE